MLITFPVQRILSRQFILTIVIINFLFFPWNTARSEENNESGNPYQYLYANTGNAPPVSNPSLNKGVILIAAKKLLDPNFEKTVILIIEYNKEGTFGLVINRRTKIPVAQALPQLTELLPLLEHLYIGGPVLPTAINLLLISGNEPAKAKKVIDDIYLIDTMELFNEFFTNNPDTEKIRLYSGYAGWAPGQLESELMRGDWYLWHASRDIVFNETPDLLWQELIQVVTAKWVMR